MNKELINLLTKDVAFWDNDGGKIAQIPRDDYDQLLVILRAKTEPSKGNKEAIELVKKVKSDLWDYTSPNVNVKNEKLSEDIELLDQALAILTEQPNCEGCEFFKHTDKFDHCWRYTEARSLCKLRQEPVEQPLAGGFTKELRRKLSDSCCAIIEDLPGWRSMVAEARVMSFEACARLDRSEAGERILEERIEKLSDTLDRSEAIVKEYGGQRCTAICSRCKRISHWCLLPQGHAGEHIHYCQFKFLESSRKELLTACEKIQQYNKASEKGQLNPDDAHDYWDSVMSYIDVAIEKANKQGECGEKERKL